MHRIHENEKELQICPHTYCLQKCLELEVKITIDGQHDGRSWTDGEVEKQKERLIQEISDEIRERVTAFVDRIEPYACHQFPD